MAASFFSKLSRTASDNVAAAAAGEGGAGGPPAQDPGASTSSSSSPEDAVHCERMRSFSKAITEFAYDKAKDLMDKSRDGSRGTSWSGFYALLSQLCLSEKSYIEFHFLQPKGLFRRDNLIKSSYDNFHTELQKMRSSSAATDKDRSSSLFRQFVAQVQTLVLCRIKMIEFYRHMHHQATAENIPKKVFDFNDCEAMVNGILTILNANSFHETLVPIQELWFIEIDFIRRLLQVLVHFNQGKVQEATLCILHLKNSLDHWDQLIKDAHEEKKKHSFSAALFGSQPEPYLYQWLNKFKQDVQSKFFLYFHKEMRKQKRPQEKRKALPVDYITRIETFQKKSEARSVCVIFNGTAVEDFKGIRVNLPFKKKPPETGLALYPAVYACPESEEPTDLWPTLIMILNQNDEALKEFTNIVYFYDTKLNCSFFLLQIDPHMTMVVIYSGQKAVSDTLTNSFMQENANQLRMQPIFAALKPRK